MRIGYGLIAGSLVLAGAIGAAWSQAPRPGVIVSPQTVTPQTVTPPASTVVHDLRLGSGETFRLTVTGMQTLDASECEQLGGSVKDDAHGVCKSGKTCTRTDNFGKIHAVCLSADAN